jgi:TPR repeat protein
MQIKQDSMHDLHGLSVEQAKSLVISEIRQACANHVGKLRFITGRGKHINSRGERGTIFKQLPEWIKEFDYTDLTLINPDLGLYEVHIKSSKLISNPLEQHMHEALAEADKIIGQRVDFMKFLAERGDAFSLYMYAGYLEKGNAEMKIEKTPKLAAEYMKKAAAAKLPPAMHEYGRYCLHGIGVKQSDEQAVEWLWKAHEAGAIESTESLARAYANAFYGLKYDFQKAFDLHTIAAKAGRTESMRFFGAIYLAGDGVAKNEKLGFEWYERAAKRGDAKAQYNMAVFYLKGIYVKPDEEKANYYFKLSADNGDPDAQNIYGQHLLSKGQPFKEEACKYLFGAAENGSEAANEYLGNISKGADAKIWLQRSAQAGNLQSQLKLDKLNGINRRIEDIPLNEILGKFRVLGINEIGLMSCFARYQLLDIILLQAKGKDRYRAFSFIQDLAEKDDPDALRRIIYFNERGDGLFKIKKDPEKTLELLNKAVNLHDPVSMVRLAGLMTLDNRNVDRFNQAFNLLQKAMKLQFPAAFYYSGVYFEKGLCEEQDNNLALICYQKAIELEKKAGHLEEFIFGPLDQYESIIEKATAGSERVKPPAKPESKSEPQSYLGMKPGFFATKKAVSQEERRKPTEPNSRLAKFPEIASTDSEPVVLIDSVSDNTLDNTQTLETESHPIYSMAEYVGQTVTGFISSFF